MTGEMIIKCQPVPEEFNERHKGNRGTAAAFSISTNLEHVNREGKVLLVRNVMKALDFSRADVLLLLMVWADQSGELADHEEIRVDQSALRREGGEA